MNWLVRSWLAIVALGFALGGLSLPTAAQAISCQCFEALEGTQGDAALLITGGSPYCAVGVSTPDCSPSHFGLAAQRVSSATGVGSGTLIYNRFCRSYRDNACQISVGTLDPNSQFNPCWTAEQCRAVDGDFDVSGTDSPNCRPYNGTTTARCFLKTPPIKLQIPIPGYGSTVTGGFAGYIAAFYKFFVAVLAIAAVVMVMWGGFKRIIAVGNPEKIKNANDAITSAITGLVLALISYSLLSLLNPRLIDSTRLKIDKVKTQLFGNWCPDTDPSNPNIQYQCGDKATIDGQACVGRLCFASGAGCYKVDDSGENDYQCLTPAQACNSILRGTAIGLHGAQDSYAGYQGVCSKFSRKLSTCLGLPGVPLTKVGTTCSNDSDCGGVASSCGTQQYQCLWQGGAERCGWYSPSDIAQVCADHEGCAAFNAGGNLKGFCTFDLCGRGCKVDGAACKL